MPHLLPALPGESLARLRFKWNITVAMLLCLFKPFLCDS